MTGRESYEHAGGPAFHRIPCLNTHPAWIAALSCRSSSDPISNCGPLLSSFAACMGYAGARSIPMTAAAAVDSPKRDMTATLFTLSLTFCFMTSCGRHASAMQQCGLARIWLPQTATAHHSYAARTNASRAVIVAGQRCAAPADWGHDTHDLSHIPLDRVARRGAPGHCRFGCSRSGGARRDDLHRC